MPVMRVDGCDLYVQDTGGDDPPVVFLHGFLFDGRQYDAQVAALRTEYRCLAIDFPGQGRSTASAVGYSTDALTRLVTRLLDELDLGPCDLVGLSMGGFTAMRIAARRPDLVGTLALLNTSARPHARSKFPKQLILAAVARLVGTSLPPVTAGIEDEMYGQLFLHDATTEPLRAVWRQRWAGSDRGALVGTLLGFMRRPDFRGELGQILAPTLIIAGGVDSSLPVGQSVEIHDAVTGSQLVVLPGVGHSAPLEDPGGVTQALRTFWAGRPNSG